jgi:hypothetical protein
MVREGALDVVGPRDGRGSEGKDCVPRVFAGRPGCVSGAVKSSKGQSIVVTGFILSSISKYEIEKRYPSKVISCQIVESKKVFLTIALY